MTRNKPNGAKDNRELLSLAPLVKAACKTSTYAAARFFDTWSQLTIFQNALM